MARGKVYTKAEDAFILSKISEFDTLKDGYEEIGKVLGRTASSIENRYIKLRKIYPNHATFSILRTRKAISAEANKSSFRKFINKIFGYGKKEK